MIKKLTALVEGLFGVVSFVMKLIGLIIISFWHILVLTGSLLFAIAPHLETAMDYMVTHLGATWDVLGDSGGDMSAAIAAGWPSEVAQGLAWVNAFLPLSEAFAMLLVLLAVFVGATVFRIIKSFIPLIAS